nr:hypothetical protein [Streptomyces polyasparticus]
MAGPWVARTHWRNDSVLTPSFRATELIDRPVDCHQLDRVPLELL